jgi:hypothetical protein
MGQRQRIETREYENGELLSTGIRIRKARVESGKAYSTSLYF